MSYFVMRKGLEYRCWVRICFRDRVSFYITRDVDFGSDFGSDCWG